MIDRTTPAIMMPVLPANSCGISLHLAIPIAEKISANTINTNNIIIKTVAIVVIIPACAASIKPAETIASISKLTANTDNRDEKAIYPSVTTINTKPARRTGLLVFSIFSSLNLQYH